MPRRKFLQSVLVAGTASLVLPARLFGSEAPNSTIRVAQIGCGRHGRSNMTNILAVADRFNVRVVAVCDVDRRRARNAVEHVVERQEGGDAPEAYQDFREVLERPDIDAVVIATPDHSHALVALAAVRAGKDVYLEKPLTYGIQEGRALVEATREHERVLQVGTQQRSSTRFRRVCELVRSGRIGTIERISVQLRLHSGTADPTPMEVPDNLDYPGWLEPTHGHPYTEERVHPQDGYSSAGWKRISAHSRGQITNWGTHMVDIALWGLGLDERAAFTVNAEAEFPDRGLFDTHTELAAELVLEKGPVMSINTDSSAPPGIRFEGSDGWAEVTRQHFDASDRALLRPPEDGDRTLAFSEDHYADWLEAILSRRDPVAPVEAGHHANTMCVATLAAARGAPGRELSWDPEAERFEQAEEANVLLDR